MEDAGSLAQLARLVPASDEEMGCRVKDTLHETDKEPDRDDVVTGRCGSEAEREHRPDEFAAWNPDGRADLGQDKLTGQLTNDITRSPCDVNHIELVRIHLEVLFHPGNVGIGNVGLIQIFDEVSEAEDGDQEAIKLLDELSLLWSPRGIIVLQAQSC